MGARYISRYARDVRILRAEKVKFVFIQGEAIPHVTKPSLVAEFRPGLESSFEKQYALAAFSGRLKWNEDGTVSFGEYLVSPEGHEMRIGGAMPDTTGRSIGIPGMNEPLQTVAYDITQKMSTFDTSWPGWSQEDEREAITLLDRDAGADYFKVGNVKVAPPWPSYDKQRLGQGSYMIILKQVKEMGFDPYAILAYEEQHDNQQAGIQNGLREYIAEQERESADEQSLQVQVQ